MVIKVMKQTEISKLEAGKRCVVCVDASAHCKIGDTLRITSDTFFKDYEIHNITQGPENLLFLDFIA